MRKQCLYERGLGWVRYDDEQVFMALRRERTRTCARMRRQKRCGCPKDKQWRCDGICDGCAYLKDLEVPLSHGIKGSDDLMIGDVLTDGIDQESVYVEKMYCEDVLKRLDEIMPMAREIGMLRMQGKSDREIARALGIDRMKMLRRLERAKAILKVEL